MITAFSTSSSMVTLPLNIECVTSDSCGAVIIARSEGESLEKMGEPANPAVD